MNAILFGAKPENQTTLKLPRDVLLFEKQRIGPIVIDDRHPSDNVVIYGFSDEPAYSRFMANSSLALRPFPLVKTYLRDQVSDESGALKLIVVDADGPAAPSVNAVTMQAVLTAFEQQSTELIATHGLEFMEATKSYRFSYTT